MSAASIADPISITHKAARSSLSGTAAVRASGDIARRIASRDAPGEEGTVIHITLAIATFMEMLIGAMLWVGARFAGYALVAAVAIAAPWWLLRRHLRRRRG